jgi:hypothetical protein
MSYFYAEISYSSKQDDSKIEKLIYPLLQKHNGNRYLGIGKLSTNGVLQSKIKYQFSKKDQRDDFIKAINNSVGDDIFAQTLPLLQ